MVYVGVDLHRKRSQVAAVDEQGENPRPIVAFRKDFAGPAKSIVGGPTYVPAVV